MGEKISFSELRKTKRLIREVARQQCDYLKKGYKSKDIAGTFAKIYMDAFQEFADEKVIAALKGEQELEGRIHGSGSIQAAIGQMSLTISSYFMKVFTARIGKNKP